MIIFLAIRILHKINWIIEINVVIKITFHEVFDIVSTTHADKAINQVRIFECKSCGVERSETTTAHRNAVNVTLLLDPGYEFVFQEPDVQ